MKDMRLTRRDFLRMSALTATGVALAGCQPPGPPAAEEPVEGATGAPPTAEEVELRWLDWSEQDDIVNQAIETFREMYPNVTINFEPIGNEWGDKQLTQMVSGTAPDILTGNDGTSYMWAERDQLLDLNPLVAADLTQDQIDDFFPYQWEGLTYPGNGIRMGLPYYPWFYQWYYNKEAFDEAGLDYPDENWTVDDYSTALTKLTQKDADGNVTRWGSVEDCYWQDRFQVWLGTFGGHLVDPDDWTHCVLGSNECQDALEWHRHRLWDTNELAQALQVASPGSYLGLDPFATGRVAMMGQGAGDIGALFQNPPGFAWGVTIPPIGPTGKRNGNGTIDNWGIWKGTSSPEMSWEFLKLIALGDDFQIGFSSLWGVPPNRTSLLAQFKEATLELYEEAKEEHIAPQIHQLTGDYVKIRQQFKRQKEARELINPVLEKIMVVGDAPVSIVEEVAEEVTALNRAEG